MTSLTSRKRGGPEGGQDGDAQSAFKFLITKDKPIPATNAQLVFSCKTCNKVFKSFQALGGHRASHNFKNPKSVGADMMPMPVTAKSHGCRICFEKFESGQALGGHMRKHWTKLFKEKTVSENSSTSKSDRTSERDELRCDRSMLVTREFFPMEHIRVRAVQTETVPALESANSWLDLKLGL